MGLLNRIRNRTTNLPQAPEATLGRGDVIPATRGSMTERATQVYRENPKLIGGIALVASALLLNRMKRPH